MENCLGTFKISSGSVYVTDPCYKIGTWCQVKVDNVFNGEWQATTYIETKTGGWGSESCCP